MGGTTGLRPGPATLPSYKLWSPHCRPPRSLWTSPVAQSVKHPPAMQVLGLDPCVGKDPLEKGMATHSSILAWRIPWGAWWATVHGSRKELDTTERLADIHTEEFTVNTGSLLWLVPDLHPGWQVCSLHSLGKSSGAAGMGTVLESPSGPCFSEEQLS